jgi:hypothetical protein
MAAALHHFKNPGICHPKDVQKINEGIKFYEKKINNMGKEIFYFYLQKQIH